MVFVNAFGAPIEVWCKVFDPIASFAKVFSCNRPGVGGSSKPNISQTASHMVESLRVVLREANFPPPYVLVGHSLCGLIVNLFARLHPAEVSAVVFVEATSPKDVEILAGHENAVQRFIRTMLDKISPPNPNAEVQHVRTSVSEILRAPPFPAIPLIVVTGGKPAMAWATAPAALAARAAHQKELACLSPRGKQIIAARSGHFPQFTEPGLVVAAVREAVEAA